MSLSDFENILLRISREIKARHPGYKGLYLYGSRIHKNINDDSDYDIVLVFNRHIDSALEKQILSIIYKYEIEYEILIDFSCYNYQDFSSIITPFRKTVLEEGKFYAA